MQTTSSSSSCCSCCSRLVGRTWVVCSTGSGRFRTHPCSFRQLVVGRARVTSRHGRYGVTQDTGQVAGRRSPPRVVLAPAPAQAPYRRRRIESPYLHSPSSRLFQLDFSSSSLSSSSLFFCVSFSLYSLICNRLILKHDPHLFFFLFSFPPNEMGYHGV